MLPREKRIAFAQYTREAGLDPGDYFRIIPDPTLPPYYKCMQAFGLLKFKPVRD